MCWEPSEGLIITIMGTLSGLVISGCMCILKSRCTRIKFCGVEMDRDVLEASDFQMAQIKPPSTVINAPQNP